MQEVRASLRKIPIHEGRAAQGMREVRGRGAPSGERRRRHPVQGLGLLSDRLPKRLLPQEGQVRDRREVGEKGEAGRLRDPEEEGFHGQRGRSVTAGTGSGRRHRVTLIPGDGIGPEITRATVGVLEATGVRFEWDLQPAGEEAMAKEGTPLPARVLESLRTNRVGLKGPVTTPVGTGFRSVNVSLRK